MTLNLSQLAGKVITIAGSSGLIGSHLLKSLKGTDAWIWSPSHESLRDQDLLPKADIVIHAAGYGQPDKFTKNPIDTIRVNTETTIYLMESLKPGGSFLFCSSSELYSGLNIPVAEYNMGTTTPQHPRSAYIEGKRCGEAIVNAYRLGGVRASSARIALAYGPGTKAHDSRVLNQFIEKALTKGRIELLDAGRAMRTYCYIDDVVETLWNIILRGTQEIYNVGGHSVISVAELAMKIGELTNAKVVMPEESNGMAGAPAGVEMNLERMEKEFDKTEYVTLDEGLKRTIEYQRRLYGI